MKKLILYLVTALLFFSSSCNRVNQKVDPERQWSSYRGYYASGVLDNADLPETWDVERGENVLWNIDIPGLSLSCPVIWGDKLFITTAYSEADSSGLRTILSGDIKPVEDQSHHDWIVYCINKNTGEILWEDIPVSGIPEIKRHPMSTHANTSMATDGDHAVAFFGSEGLYCYDMDGEVLWEKDFGKLKSVFFVAESAEWEFASSPIIHKGVVIVQVDVMEDSFVAAFDINNGDQLWKTKRDDYPGWSTPNVYNLEGKDIVVLNGFKHRAAYNFETGEEIWNMSGGGDIPVPTPIIGEDMVYFNSAHGRFSPILAVKKTAKGDITLKEDETSNEGIEWSYPRGGAYLNSMLLYDGYLYNLRLNGQIKCFDPLSGEEIYTEKIGKAELFLDSPVAADGKIYFVSVPGDVYVVKAGPEFEILQTNSLGDVFMTTPAITDGIIYFRTENQLIAVGK